MQTRHTIGPEEEKVIREDERRKVLAELTGAKPEPLTVEAIKRMTPEEYLARKAEADRVVAAWDGTTPADESQGEAA